MAGDRAKATASRLFLPLSVLGLLIVINLIKGADYFSISIINGALYGNIPNILFGASELVIISIGMTLVTASSGGQDISVGVAAAIASAVFVQFVINSNEATLLSILTGFLVSCGVGILIGAFNGSLVATFQGAAHGRNAHSVHRGPVDCLSR